MSVAYLRLFCKTFSNPIHPGRGHPVMLTSRTCAAAASVAAAWRARPSSGCGENEEEASARPASTRGGAQKKKPGVSTERSRGLSAFREPREPRRSAGISSLRSPSPPGFSHLPWRPEGMGRHLWLMHCLLPLVIGLSTPPKPLPLAERPQAAEQIVTPGELDSNYYHIVSHT